MSVYFQSILSSSSGNCLALWSESTRIVIDCGFGSMKRTRQGLASVYGEPENVDAALITHTHTDHIGYYSLRALENCGIPVHIYWESVGQLLQRHFRDYGFANLDIQPFGFEGFTIGDFHITPFEVTHNPAFRTCGFVVESGGKKIVVATDFNEWESIFGHFLDADLIFVESNHDLEMLRLNYNPNSEYHLPNPLAANLLVNICRHGKKCPKQVILGHISPQRNSRDIAVRETKRAFEDIGLSVEFELSAAPLKFPSEVIVV